MLKLIDVSYAQKEIDWEQVKSYIDGAIIRASATGWGDANECSVDAYFERNYAECKRLGIPVGAFHYGAVDTVDGAKREAAYFLNAVNGKQFELPVYYDVEDPHRFGPLDRKAVTDIAYQFCDTVENAGYFTGWYSFLNFIRDKLDYDRMKRWTLWLSQFNDKPTYEHPSDMWQKSSGGSIPGINGRVDLDECYRDFEKEIKAAHLNGWAVTPAPAPAPVSPPAPEYVPGDRVTYRGRLYGDSYGNNPGLSISGTYAADNYIPGRRYGLHIAAGWIDTTLAHKAGSGQAQTSAPAPSSKNIHIGAKVNYSGRLFANSNGGGAGKTVSGAYLVSNYLPGKPCGVLLNGGLGWVPEKDCKVIG